MEQIIIDKVFNTVLYKTYIIIAPERASIFSQPLCHYDPLCWLVGPLVGPSALALFRCFTSIQVILLHFTFWLFVF